MPLSGKTCVRCALVSCICLAFAAALLAVRACELMALLGSWDTNAYGAAVWTPLGFHTLHLLMGALDTAVLTLLMFTRRIEGTRFADAGKTRFIGISSSAYGCRSMW